MSVSLDDANPFAQLIAQSGNVQTQLDGVLRKGQAAAPEPRVKDPIIVRGKDEKEGENIGLSVRQPSFSSLLGTDIVTKSGEVVNTGLPDVCEENPVIVFDSVSHSSGDDNSPIGLTVRQPSFVSLEGNNPIPKGSACLSEFQPPIEEVEPNEFDPKVISDDESDPQVLFVKELKAKNERRWKNIGYEPPEDLIPLVRAASQAMMTRDVEGSNSLAPANSQKNLPTVGPMSMTLQPNTLPIMEVDEEAPKAKPAQKGGVRRSGSFGMPLGQKMKGQEMMAEVLGTPASKGDLTEVVDEEEDGDNNGFPPHSRLAKLPPELTGPPVRRLLVTGIVDYDEDLPAIRDRLLVLIEECSDRLWIDETEHLNELLALVSESKQYTRVLGFKGRKDPLKDIETLEELKKKEIKARDEKIKEVEEEMRAAVELIDKEYMEAAQKLDQKYQDPETLSKFAKPSKDLLEMRLVTKRLLKQNRIKEAKRHTVALRKLEAAEEERVTKLVREKYYDDDLKMKEAFAKRRDVIMEKYRQRMREAEKQCNINIQTIERQIKKLEMDVDFQTPVEERKRDWQRTDKLHREREISRWSTAAPSLAGDVPGSFAENGTLAIAAPKMLQRGNDIDILDQMTEEIRAGRSPTRPQVDVMYRQSRNNSTIKPCSKRA